MPKFIFAYHGGSVPERRKRVRKSWPLGTSWMEGLGAAIADGGNPAGMSKTVSASGVANDGGPNPISGYTLVNADTIEAACDMAKGVRSSTTAARLKSPRRWRCEFARRGL